MPAGGQVHITISDFQLNLDPTADDVMDSDATVDAATYNNVIDTDIEPDLPILSIDLTGTSGELGVSGSDTNGY